MNHLQMTDLQMFFAMMILAFVAAMFFLVACVAGFIWRNRQRYPDMRGSFWVMLVLGVQTISLLILAFKVITRT